MWKKLRLLLFWTLAYALFAALFFYILFGFKIWSDAAWHRLARMTLRGFAGLSFGASMVAAVPIYLAAVKYIWKSGRLPFAEPVPKKEEKKEDKSDAPASDNSKYTLPESLPDELRESYIRFHSGLLAKNAVDFIKNRTDLFEPEQKAPAEASFMPVPESFDAPPPAAEAHDSPVFRDMDFGMPANATPLEIKTIEGKKIATYVFDDPDFWVADDEEHWFATGKQIESPVGMLLKAAADEKILVLKSKNIMDIDKLIPEWEKKGIKVENK